MLFIMGISYTKFVDISAILLSIRTVQSFKWMKYGVKEKKMNQSHKTEECQCVVIILLKLLTQKLYS